MGEIKNKNWKQNSLLAFDAEKLEHFSLAPDDGGRLEMAGDFSTFEVQPFETKAVI